MAEDSDFLYPFIEGDERDAGTLLMDLASSVEAKETAGVRLREATFARLEPELSNAARAMAIRFDSGGRLFTLGNGGSATDAMSVASLYRHPPCGRALPARSLADDPAVLTALANDVGFELVFVRQLIAHARPGDIVLALSTSGSSRNLIAAVEHAARTDLYAIGFAGHDGGEMARHRDLDECFVVRSDSVHRVQEVQAALAWHLWSEVQANLARDANGG